jgi:hypothetical protein
MFLHTPWDIHHHIRHIPNSNMIQTWVSHSNMIKKWI